mgnify:CR=1 FL=1
MIQKTLSLTIRPAGRLGWILLVNGEPYAHGMQAYCIGVAQVVRRDFSLHGWAAFPEIARKVARHD